VDDNDEDAEGKGQPDVSQMTSNSSTGFEEEDLLPPARTLKERIHQFFENPASSKPVCFG
jgi:hypothetical protein